MAFDATDFQPITKTALEDFRDRMGRIDPKLFDMKNPQPSCGSPACFFGWARTFYFGAAWGGREKTAERLGLTHEQAADLFRIPVGDFAPVRLSSAFYDAGHSPMMATHEEALRVLDRLVRTGEVDWFAVEASAA